MPIIIEGVVRGGMIVLVDGPDLADGQRVQVVIDPQSASTEPSAVRDEAARARAIATRERADATRRSLEGRRHGDSAELVAEDRQR